MNDPIKVLFVDDEAMVLRSIERILRARRVPWQVRCVSNAMDALALLAAEDFEVIVTDLRMPEIDGAALLRRVRRDHPGVARLVMSGQTATREGLEAMQFAHQALSKPYDLASLRRTVEASANARRRVDSMPVFEAISQLACLPSPTNVHHRLSEALAAGVPLRDSAPLIETDPALTAKVLQLNKSAVLASCESDSQGGLSLCADLVTALQLGAEMYRPLESDAALPLELLAWQRHNLQIAQVASELVPAALRARAFLSGILHDVGELVALSLPAELRQPARDHAALGACLLELWGLDADLVEAVMHHHQLPPEGPARSPLVVALYLAQCVVERHEDPQIAAVPTSLAPEELERARSAAQRLGVHA